MLVGMLPVHADLVLSDFSPARPIKVMAIGDSITDDCSINGAWRRYLQPLLETNCYPFVFVGRYASTPSAPSFTKVNHEGHCGAVIAAPGAFAVHGYSTTDAYLLKIVADALAITNNRPDLAMTGARIWARIGRSSTTTKAAGATAWRGWATGTRLQPPS